MTKTIFAGEQVKKFPLEQGFPSPALQNKIFSWLAKNFFVSYCPGYASYRYRDQE